MNKPTLKPIPELNTLSVTEARENMHTSKQKNYDLLETLKGTVAGLQKKRDTIIAVIRKKNEALTKIVGKQAKELQHYREWFNNKL